MTTENQADLSTAQNNATKNESTPQAFDISKLADIVSESFLGGKENSESSVSHEQTEAEGQATSENSEVLSQDNDTATEQDESTDSEETEETKSEDNELDRGLPKGVKKRIDKLSAKRREAEAEVERLRSEVDRLSQEANKPAQTPTQDNPYAHLSTLEEVNREIDQAKQIRRWCEMNPDGAVVTGKDGNEVEYSAEEVRNIKIKSLDAMEDHLPKRMQYLQNFNQMETIAAKEYPWWKDKASRDRQIAETFLKAFPEIQKFPDYKMVIGDYISGVKARESKGKSSGVINKAPNQPKPSSAPNSISPKDVKSQQAQKRFTASNSRDDLASIIATRFL